MNVLVIGAGVIGLVVGRALALRGHDVIVAEASSWIGSGLSSRNSEVIHAGMYYPTASLRASHCVAGSHLLYSFCESHGVPYARCGKLIVATTEKESEKIAKIYGQGLENGVLGLELLDRRQTLALEPALACHSALLSTNTGIFDVHSYMLALQGDLNNNGGTVALQTPIERITREGGDWVAHFGGTNPDQCAFDAVVNAASLAAPRLAQAIEGYPLERVPRLVLAKGNYFSYRRRSPFKHLIYPAPVEGGLGIHVTMDLAGRIRFGPDVEWVEQEDYRVDPGRVTLFGTAVRRYWPELDDNDLIPDFAGLRPKLTGPGEPAADFVVEGPLDHGLPRLVNLFGIESPGLTSSLSLAEHVADRLLN